MCPTLRRVGQPFSICLNRFCYILFMQGRDKLNERVLRLTPDMVSLRLLVLRFVRSYLTDWGASPSYGEIAAALGTNRTRVRKAVRSLCADGLLLRSPGPRGLALPDDLTEAMRLLAAHGYRTVPTEGLAVTHSPLQADGVLDYCPSGQEAVAHGQEEGHDRCASGDRSAFAA